MVPAATGAGGGLPLPAVLGLVTLGFLLAGAVFAGFWALVGQTPGMRLLSIHLNAGGSREIGLRRALRRLLSVPLALLPGGLGFLAIVLSPTRRGWHDRIAGTTVVYDANVTAAPWSSTDRR